jgi:hypothetical protein
MNKKSKSAGTGGRGGQNAAISVDVLAKRVRKSTPPKEDNHLSTE